MKKLIRRIAILIFLAVIIPSCELLEDCKTCTLVTESSSGTTRGTSGNYCGTDLATKEADVPVTINGVTTYWDCQ